MKYWTFYINQDTGYKQILHATWTDHSVDLQRKEEGRVFESKLHAEAACAEEQAKRWNK